jgi:hypothetical protein
MNMAHYKMNLIGKIINFGCGTKIDNTKKHELAKNVDVWKKHNWLGMQFKVVFVSLWAFEINKNPSKSNVFAS